MAFIRFRMIGGFPALSKCGSKRSTGGQSGFRDVTGKRDGVTKKHNVGILYPIVEYSIRASGPFAKGGHFTLLKCGWARCDFATDNHVTAICGVISWACVSGSLGSLCRWETQGIFALLNPGGNWGMLAQGKHTLA
eukprot:1195415-Prorocentrum_minimum.AAC.2